MDLWEAGAQGIGLAVASGMVFGATGGHGTVGNVKLLLAAILGAFLYGISLTPEDHPAWPGWIIGAPVAALTFLVIRDIAGVASSRAGDGGQGGVAFILVLAALAVAGISLLGPAAFAAIAALLAIVYLFFSRRRKASEKHAGLRSLR